MDLQQRAQQWRREWGYTGKGGVVIVFDGEVQGWVNRLRDPESWQPSCVAIDEQGRQWVASGGNGYNGAQNWCNLAP